jgi:hypothetical protein
MSTIQEKWKANQAKVSHAKAFPGLLTSWESCAGKTILQAIPLEKRPGALLILSDHTFAVASRLDPLPGELLEGIRLAKPVLGAVYPEAYRELERWAETDRELTRRSRMENILGAIKNNISAIPELKKEITDLLSRLPDPQ